MTLEKREGSRQGEGKNKENDNVQGTMKDQRSFFDINKISVKEKPLGKISKNIACFYVICLC